jgi:hypothetical protein
MAIPLERVVGKPNSTISFLSIRYVPTKLALQAYCHEDQVHKFTSLTTPIQSPLAHFEK